MAAVETRREQERPRPGLGSGPAPAEGSGRSLSGQSYWLDLWLFILFDVALFVVIYLLP